VPPACLPPPHAATAQPFEASLRHDEHSRFRNIDARNDPNGSVILCRARRHRRDRQPLSRTATPDERRTRAVAEQVLGDKLETSIDNLMSSWKQNPGETLVPSPGRALLAQSGRSSPGRAYMADQAGRWYGHARSRPSSQGSHAR